MNIPPSTPVKAVKFKASRRPKPTGDNVAELHSLDPPSNFAIYCPWPVDLFSTGEATPKTCNELVHINSFEDHLKHSHKLQDGDLCRLPLALAGFKVPTICGTRMNKPFSRHILGKVDERKDSPPHSGPFQGCRISSIVGTGSNERVNLPKITCKYCFHPFSMYVGGHKESLNRHLQQFHPDKVVRSRTIGAGNGDN